MNCTYIWQLRRIRKNIFYPVAEISRSRFHISHHKNIFRRNLCLQKFNNQRQQNSSFACPRNRRNRHSAGAVIENRLLILTRSNPEPAGLCTLRMCNLYIILNTAKILQPVSVKKARISRYPLTCQKCKFAQNPCGLVPG